MADCEKFIKMISSLVDCELSPDEEAELRTHMESCDNCRHVYETFKGISGAISEDLVKPPESLSKGIMYRIETQGKIKKPRFFAFGRFTGIAACLVLILFGASKFGWFDKTVSSPDSISEETSLSISDSAESEDVPETQIESSSDSNLLEEKGEDNKSGSSDGMMFTTPMTDNSSDNVTQSGESLNELFASDEIKIFKGSYDINSSDPLIISDANTQTKLLDILGYSGDEIADPKLSDTPDYTLLFPDKTELHLYFVDGSIYCKLENCKTVYIATGTIDEFESLIDSNAKR